MQNSMYSLLCSLNLVLLILVGFVMISIYPFVFHIYFDKSFTQTHVCNFQVPSAINQRRRRFLAIKWLIKAAREQQKGNARMYKKLAKELMDAYNKEVGSRFYGSVLQFVRVYFCLSFGRIVTYRYQGLR